MVLPIPTSSAIRRRGHWQTKRHQQGHELIGARLECQLRRRPERTCAPTECQTKRVGKKGSFELHSSRRIFRKFETGRHDRLDFQFWIEETVSCSLPVSGRSARTFARDVGKATHSRPRARTRSPGENARVIHYPVNVEINCAGTPPEGSEGSSKRVHPVSFAASVAEPGIQSSVAAT